MFTLYTLFSTRVEFSAWYWGWNGRDSNLSWFELRIFMNRFDTAEESTIRTNLEVTGRLWSVHEGPNPASSIILNTWINAVVIDQPKIF